MKLKSILVGLGVVICASAVQAAGFQQDEYSQGVKNAANQVGSDYDEALTKALQGQPQVVSGMSACLKQHPGRQTAFGYFAIRAKDSYTVELMPSNAFTACLSKALSGHKLPPPPSLPWINDFKFSTDPKPAAPAVGSATKKAN